MWVHVSGTSSGKVEWDQKAKKIYIGLDSNAYISMYLEDAKRLHRNLGINIKLANVQGSVKNANE